MKTEGLKEKMVTDRQQSNETSKRSRKKIQRTQGTQRKHLRSVERSKMGNVKKGNVNIALQILRAHRTEENHNSAKKAFSGFQTKHHQGGSDLRMMTQRHKMQ